MKRVLKVEGLSKAFGGIKAVNNVSFELHEGQLLAMIGPNGAGKSTCFNLINGQLRPDRGTIIIMGKQINGSKPRDVFRLGVGRSFQVTATLPSMTVLENVQMALLSFHKRTKSMVRKVRSLYVDEAMTLLKQVGIDDQSNRSCGVLAYGDLKRVELAVALANQPRLLLMDEPTAGMGVSERMTLMQLTSHIVRTGNIGVLFTEHDMDVVFGYADRIIVLNQGELVAEGKPEEVRSNKKVQEIYLGTDKEPSAPHTFQALPPQRDRGSRPMAAWVESDTRSSGVSDENNGVMLNVEGLNTFYGKAQILFDISLKVRGSEITVLLGRNGAGKTTTLKSIMGIVSPRSGKVTFKGQEIHHLSPFKTCTLGLGYVPEDRRIFSKLTIMENLEVGRQSPREGLEPWTPERLFELFPHLKARRNQEGGRLSGGEQQMLTIARTLMGNPEMIILDEPSEGLAPVIVQQLAKTIRELKKIGVSNLLAEQNLTFAGSVCDMAYILYHGSVCHESPIHELSKEVYEKYCAL
jgi:branched-chain amino acid transport system ATP-binding protein